MAYYRTCPDCGAHLDPGERCDCRDARRDWAAKLIAPLTFAEKTALLETLKNAPVSVTSTDGGGVERVVRPVSVPTISENGGFVNG